MIKELKEEYKKLITVGETCYTCEHCVRCDESYHHFGIRARDIFRIRRCPAWRPRVEKFEDLADLRWYRDREVGE